jgi:hypothetical protein
MMMTHGRDEKFIKYFGYKSERERPLGKPMRRLKDI